MNLRTFWHRVLAFLMTSVLHLIVKTCRVKIKGLDQFEEAITKGSSILSFWHDGMAIIPAIFGHFSHQTKFVACVSKSRDGDLLEAVIDRYPSATCIRIGHRNRGFGLLEMIKEAEKGNCTLVITPDGPKGPAKVMKAGMLEVAHRTGASIFTVAWKCSNTYYLPTWDRFRIPLPFSKIDVIVSAEDAHPDNVASGMNALK